jgi:hypothetical protein
MGTLYRWLLYLYPEEFRRRFAEEMCWVYAEASASAARAGFARQSLFLAREVCGMVRGAAKQQAYRLLEGSLIPRRFVMATFRTRFRFPIAGIGFMVACLGLVLTAIRHARALSASFAGTVQKFGTHEFVYQPDRISLLQSFGFAFGLTLVVTVVVWAVLHTMRRSGVHRLEDAQTWPQQ